MNTATKICVLLFIMLISRAVSAGVFLCNETGSKMYVAIGFKSQGQWISKGWFSFEPKECNALITGIPENRYFYYYAESESGKRVWSGRDQLNAGYFCIDEPKAFNYINTTSNCKGKDFKLLDLGNTQQYILKLNEENNPRSAALNCQGEMQSGIDVFAKCWMRNMATDKQQSILNCWDRSETTAEFAICANKDKLSEKQYEIVNCTARLNKDHKPSNFAGCIADSQFGDKEKKIISCAIKNKDDYASVLECSALDSLSPDQQKIYECVAHNTGSYINTATCLAADKLTPEQNRLMNCVLKNRESYTQMGVCAVGNNLSPEQQAFVSCAMTTGGQPYAFAGCVGTTLTINELQKCMTAGIGGDEGCFGNNNTIVKFVSNAFNDITQGPGPSNDLLGRDGWVGRRMQDAANDINYGPGHTNDVVGADGYLCTALFGGC